jgi:hypothetical protein
MTTWTPESPVQLPVDNPLPPVVVSPYARAYVRRHATAHMYYTVAISRMTDPVFDTESGVMVAAVNRMIYFGPARIWTVSGPQVLGVGEDQMSFDQSFVSIPWDTDPIPNRDDIVTVQDYDPVYYYGDEQLVGRSFRVTNVQLGGQMYATRRLNVTGIEPSSAWGPDATQ